MATGEFGLGWETVSRLNMYQFSELQQVQTLVRQYADKEGREDLERELATERMDAMERVADAPPPDPALALLPLDPLHATPEMIAAHIAANEAQWMQ